MDGRSPVSSKQQQTPRRGSGGGGKPVKSTVRELASPRIKDNTPRDFFGRRAVTSNKTRGTAQEISCGGFVMILLHSVCVCVCVKVERAVGVARRVWLRSPTLCGSSSMKATPMQSGDQCEFRTCSEGGSHTDLVPIVQSPCNMTVLYMTDCIYHKE